MVLRPDAVITLAGQSLTAAEGAVVRITVQQSVVGAHDAVTLDLWPNSKFADAEPGSALEVELGHRDETELVFTGEVDEVGPGPLGVRVYGLAASVALSRKRVSRAYSEMSASDIVRDLAEDVTLGEVDASTSFSAYAVDARRTVWRHLWALAEVVGAEVGSDADGALRFVPPRTAGTDATLRRGAELLAWQVGPARSPEPLPIVAHGAASEAGTWHWLRRDPGAGDPAVVVGAFAQREAADAANEARAAQAARAAIRGTLLAVGDPTVRAGSLLELDGLDVPELVRAREVVHELDGERGYTVRAVVEGSGASGLGGLLGGLL